MTNTVSVEIDLAREIYERLLSQGWKKIEKVWSQKESQIYAAKLNDKKILNSNEMNINLN